MVKESWLLIWNTSKVPSLPRVTLSTPICKTGSICLKVYIFSQFNNYVWNPRNFLSSKISSHTDSCNMETNCLPEIYALALRPSALVLEHIYNIRQTISAHVTTNTFHLGDSPGKLPDYCASVYVFIWDHVNSNCGYIYNVIRAMTTSGWEAKRKFIVTSMQIASIAATWLNTRSTNVNWTTHSEA